jgi:hypothetical protein
MRDQQHETVRVYDTPDGHEANAGINNGTSPSPHQGDTIDALIDELEAVAVDGRRVPFTHTLLLHQDTLLDLVDRLRATVPNDVRQAQRVLNQQHQIVEHAQAQAMHTLQERGLMQRLETERQVIVAEAQRDAERTRYEADKYARDVLVQLQKRLEQVQSSVQQGIDTLDSERQTQ